MMRLRHLAAALAFSASTLQAGEMPAAFEIEVPQQLATGQVTLRAIVNDARVAVVKWYFDKVAYNSRRPKFETPVTMDTVQPQRLRVVAYDKDNQALYERRTIINPGVRNAYLEVISPVSGERIQGEALVQVRAVLPSTDTLEQISLNDGTSTIPLRKNGEFYEAMTTVHAERTFLTVTAKTSKRGTLEEVITLNSPPDIFIEQTEAVMIEQLLRLNAPLNPNSVKVRDDGGTYDVRELKPLTDLPVNIGLLMSITALSKEKFTLEKAASASFIENVMRPDDSAFLMAYGPFIRTLQDWTQDKDAVKERVLSVAPASGDCESLLYDSTIKALYQFQGDKGAKMLVILSDGYDYGYADPRAGGDPCDLRVMPDGTPVSVPRGSTATEQEVIRYAKESGVVLYFIGIDAKGKLEGTDETRWVVNKGLMAKMANETAGKAYFIQSTGELTQAFKDIEDDMRTQYKFSYQTKAKRKGEFHPIEITVDGKRIKTSAGFFY